MMLLREMLGKQGETSLSALKKRETGLGTGA